MKIPTESFYMYIWTYIQNTLTSWHHVTENKVKLILTTSSVAREHLNTHTIYVRTYMKW